MKQWIYSWQERKRPKATGMIWRGGVLSYRWIGPSTLFFTRLAEQFFKVNMSCSCSLFETRPLPANTGNTIHFFTYQLGDTK